MGKEIELKLPLAQNQFDTLFSTLYSGKEIDGIITNDYSNNAVYKSDEYYSKYDTMEERKNHSEPQVIRIRTEKNEQKSECFFTIKRKTIQNGIEVNKEDETYVEDAEVLREFFKEAGYIRWFNKQKTSYSAHCILQEYKDLVFHVELVIVNELKYLEIEITDENVKEEIAQEKLNLFVKTLGLNPENKDERSWVKILSEIK